MQIVNYIPQIIIICLMIHSLFTLTKTFDFAKFDEISSFWQTILVFTGLAGLGILHWIYSLGGFYDTIGISQIIMIIYAIVSIGIGIHLLNTRTNTTTLYKLLALVFRATVLICGGFFDNIFDLIK